MSWMLYHKIQHLKRSRYKTRTYVMKCLPASRGDWPDFAILVAIVLITALFLL